MRPRVNIPRPRVKAIGIDLGLTYTRVAVYKDNCVKMVRNEEGIRDTPSCVAFRDGKELVGEAAMDQASLNTSNTIYDIKRLIGRRFLEPSVQNYIKTSPFTVFPGPGNQPLISISTSEGERRLAADEICAMLLREIKASADRFLRCDVKDCVMTVPADFSRVQREATANAARLAGMNVMRIITEPVAAALAYALHRETALPSGKSYALIFDLGSGSLSVSVVSVYHQFVEVEAVAGNSHLGGKHFDARMVNHFVKEFREKHGKDITDSARAMFKLEAGSERAKRALSVSSKATVDVDALFERIDFCSTITREEFEELNMNLLEMCLEPVTRCLRDAKVEKSDIDNIVLVGGSSRIPKVQELLKSFFDGKELCKSHVNRDEAVAVGAAQLASFLIGNVPKMLLVDAVPRSLGVEIAGGDYSVVIPRNTTIPTEKEVYFSTFPDSKGCAKLGVFEGEGALADGNDVVARYELCNLPPAPPGGLDIRVTLKIDPSSNLLIMAHTDKGASIDCTPRVNATPSTRFVGNAKDDIPKLCHFDLV